MEAFIPDMNNEPATPMAALENASNCRYPQQESSRIGLPKDTIYLEPRQCLANALSAFYPCGGPEKCLLRPHRDRDKGDRRRGKNRRTQGR